jgi:hypothetical protein
MEPVLQMCDPILTQTDAERPVLSVLLPVPGLRRDTLGNLTDDSIQTIMEGVKSLGIHIDSDSTKTAMLQEAKSALCKLNAQYEFLLGGLLNDIARSNKAGVTKQIVETMKEKNQSMQDVLSVSRYIIDMQTDTVKEGFLGTEVDPFVSYRETFQTMEETIAANTKALATNEFTRAEDRTLKISEDKNIYAERLTNLYGVLNIVSIGLLFYIMYN